MASLRGLRIKRLLDITALIRGPVAWNTRSLANRFETCRRNILRDLDALRLAGIPCRYDPNYGPGGGYRIDSAFMPTLRLSDSGCVSLALLIKISESQCIPMLDMAEIRDALYNTISDDQMALVKQVAASFEVLTSGLPDHSGSRETLSKILTAILKHRQVEITYESPHDARPKRLRLEARKLFLFNQVFYFVGYDLLTREDKILRVARCRNIRVLNKSATLANAHFTVRQALGNSWTVRRGDRDYKVEIRFDRKSAPVISEVRFHPTQEIVKNNDGSVTFRATVSGLEEISQWVLGFGPAAVVLAPEALRETVRNLLRSTLDHYQSPA